MRRPARIGPAVAALILSGACATMVRGTEDYLYIITEPQGAHVATSLGADCTAPCTMILPRRSKFEVTISHPGYETWHGNVTFARRGKLPLDQSAIASATAGAAGGTAAGVAAAAASGNLALTIGGGVGATAAGAGAIAAGALAGAVAPLAIDEASGANLDLYPNPLVVALSRTAPGGELRP